MAIRESDYYGSNSWPVYGGVCRPRAVDAGVCTWCGAFTMPDRAKLHDLPSTTTFLRTQTGGGEVRDYPCWHCQGTGVEPPTLWHRFKRLFGRA